MARLRACFTAASIAPSYANAAAQKDKIAELASPPHRRRPWRDCGRVSQPLLSRHHTPMRLPKKIKSPKRYRSELASSLQLSSGSLSVVTSFVIHEGHEKIAVGTLIAERPPHRTVRAGFPHTAPTSGD